jgi:uncharacterized protein with HEPN domain
MSRHDTHVRLRHMLDAACEATQMARGKTRADLDTERPLNLSLVRLLEIVGEAASRVPVSERAQYSGIPWGQIVGLRNRLIHGYDNVDFDILWEIVTQDLAPLIAELEKILSSNS